MVVAHAQPDLSKTKFYRVKNHSTGRYMTLKDNKGELNVSKSKFDFGAIVPVESFDVVRCDPGSVIQWEEPTPLAYYLNAQGTSTKDIVSMPVKLQTVSGYDGLYAIYGTATKKTAGMSVTVSAYLCDTGTEKGLHWCSYKDLNEKNGFWEIIPVQNNADSYFAAQPEINAKGKFYTTLYTSFGYQLGTETTAYFVEKVSNDGSLQVRKINPGGWIPAGSAVILECVSSDPEKNKLLPVEYTTPLNDNVLKGVYFNNTTSGHKNQTAYDPTSMRVLKVDAEGNVVLGKTTDKYLAANRAYLTVPTGCPDELVVPLAKAKVYETYSKPENPEDNMNHGTAANPISVADAISYANTIGAEASANNFYVKGKISSIKYEYSAQYGTATYNISSDGSTGKEFTVYGSYYFNNMSWQKGQTQIAVGDEVVVCGRIMLYDGKTPEFADKMNYLVSLNGKTSSDPVENPEDKINHGTTDAPISVAEAIAAAEAIGTDASANDFYVKGKICSIKYEYSAEYGTATYNISEDGSEGTVFTVYNSYYFDNKSWQVGDNQIAVGDEVIVCGKIINYNGNTPELASKQNYLVSLNGNTATGIQSVITQPNSGGAVYNLTGQRVEKPTQKGIYLINGKKVLVK